MIGPSGLALGALDFSESGQRHSCCWPQQARHFELGSLGEEPGKSKACGAALNRWAVLHQPELAQGMWHRSKLWSWDRGDKYNT